MKQHRAAYILAGGESRRMGQDKGLITWKGKKIVEHIADAVSPLVDEIFIVSPNEAYDVLPYDRIEDVYPGRGPLAGIHTAMCHTNHARNFVLSCDAPLLSTSFLNWLLQNATEDADVTYPLVDGKDMPLIGIYATYCKGVIEAALFENNLRVRDVLDQLLVQTIETPKTYQTHLMNMNTPQDVELLENKTNEG